MKKIKPLVFTSFKSFGDFIILLTVIRDYKHPFRLIAGSHLKYLFSSLNIKVNIYFLDIGNSNVPSLFNVKKDGFLNAFLSLINIKIYLFRNIKASEVIVFDKFSFRELLLSFLHQKFFLNKDNSHNIYLDYEKYLNISLKNLINKRTLKRNIAIFPESRDKNKMLPATFVKDLVLYLESMNFFVTTIIVDKFLLNKFNDCNTKLNINSFDGLIKNIKENNVISADSLPSHIAEHFNIPNFVYVSKPNEYWVPYSCYNMHYWDIYGSFKYLNKWLDSIS